MTNQVGGFCPNYPRMGGNQGWNRKRNEGWGDRDKKEVIVELIGRSVMATTMSMYSRMSVKNQ